MQLVFMSMGGQEQRGVSLCTCGMFLYIIISSLIFRDSNLALVVAELKAGAQKRDAEVAELRQDLAATQRKVARVEREVDDITRQESKKHLVMSGKGTSLSKQHLDPYTG